MEERLESGQDRGEERHASMEGLESEGSGPSSMCAIATGTEPAGPREFSFLSAGVSEVILEDSQLPEL